MAGISGLMLMAFASGTKVQADQEPKTTRHIRMVKIENGKKMELDTILNSDDVFVWNGDTLNPARLAKHPHVQMDRIRGNENVFIRRAGKNSPQMKRIQNDGEDVELISEDIDSLGRKLVVRKRIKDRKLDELADFETRHRRHFSPVPPMPPVPPVHPRMMNQAGNGQFINLNDPNVVSFKKKDLKGGLEKIEIVRKKSDNQLNAVYDFRFDEDFEMPDITEMEFNIQKMKEIENHEKTRTKNIEVELETENTK